MWCDVVYRNAKQCNVWMKGLLYLDEFSTQKIVDARGFSMGVETEMHVY